MNLTTTNSSSSYRPLMIILNNISSGISAANFCVGLPLQSYVLYLMVGRTGWLDPSDVFSLNVAMVEIITCFSIVNYWLKEWHRLVYVFFKIFSLSARPLFQCCVCLERYLAVIHPVVFLRLKPLQYRVVFSAAIWLMVLFICASLPLLHHREAILQFLYCGMTLYGLLVLVQLFLCLSILQALRKPCPGDRHTGMGNEGKREGGAGMNPANKKAFNIVLGTLLSLVLACILACISIFTRDTIPLVFSQVMSLLSIITEVLFGYLQAFLYLYKVDKLRCLLDLKKI